MNNERLAKLWLGTFGLACILLVVSMGLAIFQMTKVVAWVMIATACDLIVWVLVSLAVVRRKNVGA